MSMQDIDKAPANMDMPQKNTGADAADAQALGGGKVQGMVILHHSSKYVSLPLFPTLPEFYVALINPK